MSPKMEGSVVTKDKLSRERRAGFSRWTGGSNSKSTFTIDELAEQAQAAEHRGPFQDVDEAELEEALDHPLQLLLSRSSLQPLAAKSSGLRPDVADVGVGHPVLDGRRAVHVERLPDGADRALDRLGVRGPRSTTAISRARPAGRSRRHHLGHQAEAEGGGGGDPLLVAHERPAQHVTERHAR